VISIAEATSSSPSALPPFAVVPSHSAAPAVGGVFGKRAPRLMETGYYAIAASGMRTSTMTGGSDERDGGTS
jgi:hypothetical protein